MLIKVHKSENKVMISIADKDLIGKEFEEGEKYLQIPKGFYEGEELEEKETLDLLKDANSLNVVGEKSVNFCIKNKLIEKGHILEVKTIPFAIVIFDE
jgi:hypothetical protein